MLRRFPQFLTNVTVLRVVDYSFLTARQGKPEQGSLKIFWRVASTDGIKIAPIAKLKEEIMTIVAISLRAGVAQELRA